VATHYDVLGVPQNAAPEVIRRAYLDLARALHPDRTHGEAPADAELASRRMQEVNEAWRVLREPASRAAYDRAHSLARRSVSRPAAAAPPPRHLFEDDDDDLDRPFISAPAEPGDIGVTIVRALPWVAITVVLGAIFVFTAFAGNDRQPSGPQDLVGRCVSSGNVAAIVAVPCQGPNDGKVVLVVDRASLCPDGSSSRPIEGDQWLCLEPNNPIPPPPTLPPSTTVAP
jgi:hypothetical protein